MIKITHICDTCGAQHSHTFDTWDEAYNYCSMQDRRQTSTTYGTGHTDTNYDLGTTTETRTGGRQ